MNTGLIRVRDFARACGCTPQNIYGHLKTYAADLEGHTVQGKGRQGVFLDEFAQDFLKSIMYPKDLSENVLHDQINELRGQLMQVETARLRLSARLVEVEAERDRALIDVEQHQKRLVAAEEAKEAEISQAKEEAASSAAEAQRAQQALAVAHTAFEEDLRKKNERIQGLEAYAAAQKARADFFAIPWFKRIGKKAPPVPELQEDE